MSLDVRESAGEQYNVAQERLKFIFLGVTYFFIVCGYSIIKDLKDAVFVTMIGRTYVPLAKLLVMAILIPAIFFYAKIVDRLRRYQLLAFYAVFFGVMGIVFAIFLGHPTIGLANTNTNPNRIFGWLFYFCFEGYQPFVVNVFWSFAHSITSPKGAKNNYPFMVSASKVGGMVGAGLGWLCFSWYGTSLIGSYDDVLVHQIVLGVASCAVLVIPVVVYMLMKKVSGRYLHGYEAAYQAEKQKGKEGKEKTGMGAGLVMLLKYPYVLGIFGMVYFYELIATVLNYMRLGVAQSHAVNLSQMSSNLLQMTFMMHVFGFFVSFFGTSVLMKKLGERRCLMLIPISFGILLTVLMVNTTPLVFTVVWVVLRAINYAFAWPVRESLYIPTVKSIKFKSKAWIDAFGGKAAKSGGSVFIVMLARFEALAMAGVAYSIFFASVVSLWFGVAYFLGRRFDKAVANNEVIGLEKSDSD